MAGLVSNSKLFSVIMILALSFMAQAQDGNYPPNAEVGKCYSQMYVPNEYDYKEVTEIDRPSYKKKIQIPAIYEYVYDTIIVTPAQKKLEVVPESYTTVIETVMVAPPTTKWVTGKRDPNCLSDNPADCKVVCLVEVPAKYTTYSRRVLDTPSYTREINVPAEIKISTRKILKSPARVEEYEVPATYKTVMKRVVSKKGGYTEWKEILCDDQCGPDLIKKVQQALNAKGYDAGPADGVMGAKTIQALVQYQTDKKLPLGKELNLETVRSLGIDYSRNKN
ncbi:MAG: peptidoglycan-binding domain-containing protein [Chitinophagales bacterium]|nr:peptidoglycan-binding domain-containing protein [Chitinophagales bacterium]